MKKRNIPVMYLITFFQGMVFYASISTLYRLERGLTLSQYAIIDSIALIMSVLLEVPWGMIADRIGYKKTFLIANRFYLISKFVFLNASGFVGFLLERVFFALAVSGISGVDTSILYLSCDGRESQKVFGRYGAFGNAGVMISAGIFALFELSHSQAALFTTLAYSCALAASVMLVEVKGEKQERGNIDFTGMIKSILKDYRLLLFLLSGALISVCSWVIVVFLNQGQYLANGATERFIGLTFIITSLADFLGVFSSRITDRFGDLKGGLLIILGMGVTAILLSFSQNMYLSLILISLTDVLHSLYVPLESRLQSDHVSVTDRATMMSIYMMAIDLFSALPNIMMGLSGEKSIPVTFRWCGLLLVLSSLGYVLFVTGKKNKSE
ncbi:MAG: MFS transporter [Erysipelotrichaceae bacterium]|nr:MFS transporter [Erysipelotrichaceae bacterium]MBQ1523199.1 MFS transporter [Erysipelotrichaceae bacterium]